jgi:uncharacterized membrane protein
MKNKRATSKPAADTIAIPRSQIVIYSIVALISLAGLADATYLAVQALTGETMVCGGSPDCFKVLGSPYARIGGVPLALVGAVAYFSVFSFAILAAFGYARVRRFPAFYGVVDVRSYSLAALHSGIHSSRVLPLLSVFRGNGLSPCRVDRCQPFPVNRKRSDPERIGTSLGVSRC